MMKEEMKAYWEQGYKFVAGDCWGDSELETWEDVEEVADETEEEQYLKLQVTVEEEEHLVYLYIDDEE